MGWQRVRHDWVTELNWTCNKLGMSIFDSVWFHLKSLFILCHTVTYFTSVCYKSHYTFFSRFKQRKHKKKYILITHIGTFAVFFSVMQVFAFLWNDFPSAWRTSFNTHFLYLRSVGDKFFQLLFVWKCLYFTFYFQRYFYWV